MLDLMRACLDGEGWWSSPLPSSSVERAEAEGEGRLVPTSERLFSMDESATRGVEWAGACVNRELVGSQIDAMNGRTITTSDASRGGSSSAITVSA